MSTWIKIARYQLTDRYVFVTGPWLILALNFLITVVLVADWPGRDGHAAYSGPAAIYVYLIVTGALGIARQLPFALALGVSRRSFYAGTALLAVALAARLRAGADRAAAHRAGHRRLGPEHALLPGAVPAGRAVVSHLAHLVRGPGPDVRLGHVVRDRLPALEPGRPAQLHRRAGPGGDSPYC